MQTASRESTERGVERSVGRLYTTASVSVTGRSITYAEYGDPGGRPVVLFHGTPGTHRLGGLFAPAAAEQGVRLLAVDRPGYGDSESWPERSLTDIGAVVTTVLDDAGVERAGLIGFSGGGPHALAVAATHGDRVTSVDVISGSTPPDGDSPAMQQLLAGMATSIPRLFRGLFSGQAWLARHRSPSVFLSQYTDRATDTFDAAVVDLLTDDFVAAVGGRRQGIATEFRLLAEEWEFSVDEIDTPVRFWHGQQDGNVPLAGVEQLGQRLPNSDLTTLDGDHLSTLLDCRERVVEGHAP